MPEDEQEKGTGRGSVARVRTLHRLAPLRRDIVQRLEGATWVSGESEFLLEGIVTMKKVRWHRT